MFVLMCECGSTNISCLSSFDVDYGNACKYECQDCGNTSTIVDQNNMFIAMLSNSEVQNGND